MDRQEVKIRTGKYNHPMGTLEVSPAGGISFTPRGGGPSAEFQFNSEGVFRGVGAISESPQAGVTIPGVVSVCAHIVPGYTGNAFQRVSRDGITIVACESCVKLGATLEGGVLQFIDFEIWEQIAKQMQLINVAEITIPE